VRRAQDKVKEEAPKVKRIGGDKTQREGKPLPLHERMALEFKKRKEKIENKSAKRREVEPVPAAKDCEDPSVTSLAERRENERTAQVRRKGWTSNTLRRKEPIAETHYMRQLRTVGNKAADKPKVEVAEGASDSQTVLKVLPGKTMAGSGKDANLDTPSYLRTTFNNFSRGELAVATSSKKSTTERKESGGAYFGGARRGTAGAKYMGGEARAPDDNTDLVTIDCVEPMDSLQIRFQKGSMKGGGGRDGRGDERRDHDRHATDARGRELDDDNCDDQHDRKERDRGRSERERPRQKAIPRVLYMDGRRGYTENCMTPGDEDGRDVTNGDGLKGNRFKSSGR
jgi:hypothetical protein